jgi:hypothetical protein
MEITKYTNIYVLLLNNMWKIHRSRIRVILVPCATIAVMLSRGLELPHISGRGPTLEIILNIYIEKYNCMPRAYQFKVGVDIVVVITKDGSDDHGGSRQSITGETLNS